MGASCQNICPTKAPLSSRQQRPPIPGQTRTAAGPRFLRPAPLRRQLRGPGVRAFNGSDSNGKAVGSGGGGGFRGGLDPSLEMAVPSEQRPVNELASLRQASLDSWVRPHHTGVP